MGAARVLVVDDSSTIRRVVSQVLRRAGHDVATAEDGAAALAEARTRAPHLIILDFMMPGMNGYQLLKQLAVEERQIPVVLMSTRTDEVPEGGLRALGVVDRITKPFSPEAIAAIVAHRLEKMQPDSDTARALEEAATMPGILPVGMDELQSTDPRVAPAGPAPVLARIIADALFARGVADADAVANALCADLVDDARAQHLQSLVQRPQLCLSGDLAAVPLPEVLQLLKFQGQTGVLEIALDRGPQSAPARFDVAVKDGLVVAVRARDVRADLLLGNYFVGAGLVSRAQLEAALARPAHVPIGQRLVEAGLINAEQLRACVGAQAQDLIVELLRARRGYFGLRRGEDVLPASAVSPGFSIDMLLFEALRRIDEWSVIESQVTSFETRFARVEHQLPEGTDDLADLTLDEILVLSTFRDGAILSVHEVLSLSALRAFDACKLLYRLTLLRRLRRVEDDAGAARASLDARLEET